jgi:hypothetical protein
MGKMKFMQELKEMAKTTSESTSRIVGTQLASADDALKGILPSVESLNISVRSHRNENTGQVRKKITSLTELEIPDDFRLTNHGSIFLQHDTGTSSGNQRLLCFGTSDSMHWLENSTMIFADGIFKASFQLFQQLYVIEGFQEPKVFPCLYFLLPAKSEAIYDVMISQTKKMCPKLNPSTIMTDFEPAALNAFKKAFKNAKE